MPSVDLQQLRPFLGAYSVGAYSRCLKQWHHTGKESRSERRIEILTSLPLVSHLSEGAFVSEMCASNLTSDIVKDHPVGIICEAGD